MCNFYEISFNMHDVSKKSNFLLKTGIKLRKKSNNITNSVYNTKTFHMKVSAKNLEVFQNKHLYYEKSKAKIVKFTQKTLFFVQFTI